MNQEPIFLLGAHKSGTSMLRSLFDGHSKLFTIPIESHIFALNGYWVDYGIRRQYPDSKITSAEIKKNYIDWIVKSNTTPGGLSDGDTMGLWNIESFTDMINSGGNYQELKYSIENYVKAMYFSLNQKKLTEDTRVVEKSVENAEFAMDLKKLYPKSKFIHIIRNPYSNLVSLRKYRNKRFAYPPLLKVVNSLNNSYYYLEKNQRLIPDYLVVRYEDLVSDSSTIEKIADFLNLEKEDILYKPTANGNLWQGNSTSGKKFDGISADRLNDWQKDIFQLEVNIINKLFSHILEKYNYGLRESKNYLSACKGERADVYIFNRLLYKFFLQA